MLTAAAALIEERAEAIAQDMTREMGKPLREARMEAGRAAQFLRYSAGEAFRPVGGWTTRAAVENATSPTLNRSGSWSTKSEAAFLAAASRVGLTSVALIDADTSIVMTIVASSRGTATTSDGRARAMASAATAPR